MSNPPPPISKICFVDNTQFSLWLTPTGDINPEEPIPAGLTFPNFTYPIVKECVQGEREGEMIFHRFSGLWLLTLQNSKQNVYIQRIM